MSDSTHRPIRCPSSVVGIVIPGRRRIGGIAGAGSDRLMIWSPGFPLKKPADRRSCNHLNFVVTIRRGRAKLNITDATSRGNTGSDRLNRKKRKSSQESREKQREKMDAAKHTSHLSVSSRSHRQKHRAGRDGCCRQSRLNICRCLRGSRRSAAGRAHHNTPPEKCH